MAPETEPTAVILRRWRPSVFSEKTLIALFPEIDAGYPHVLSYEHVGQHGGGDYYHIMRQTTPVAADHPDAVELLEELKQLGYIPIVRRRMNPKTFRSKT